MRIVFADCELDTQLYVVRRGTTQRHLRPKPFQVLLYLLEHCDRIVPKQELAERLWPERYVSDTVIENSILAARQAVGDSGRERRIIQTLYGHGYRFVAPVTVVRDETAGDAVKASRPEALARPSEGTHAAQEVENVDTAQIRRTSASLPIEATRRRLTVLCCDLVGTSDLARQIDPEDYADVIRAYHAACVGVIERFEGYLAQRRGDGLLVYFGYPQAHEEDAQRALHTALGMLQALRQLNGQLRSTHGLQVAVRMGIHTGLAVVSAIDTVARAEPLALGRTPHIAAQLQELAAPDTVVLSATTYRLVHGYFACQALGVQSVHGLVEPIEAYQVLQASGVRSRFAVAVSRGLTSLVGRKHELGLLLEQWAQAKDGSGRVMLITGEVGIGTASPDLCKPSRNRCALTPIRFSNVRVPHITGIRPLDRSIDPRIPGAAGRSEPHSSAPHRAHVSAHGMAVVGDAVPCHARDARSARAGVGAGDDWLGIGRPRAAGRRAAADCGHHRWRATLWPFCVKPTGVQGTMPRRLRCCMKG